jgi:hypothetical protein
LNLFVRRIQVVREAEGEVGHAGTKGSGFKGGLVDNIVKSAYDTCRLGLVANGYHPHPIGPGSKKPMVVVSGEYREMHAWQSPDRGLAPSPQPGAGVGVRLGLQRGSTYLVALDWDDDDLALRAMYDFPSAVAKQGAKGNTTFFVAHREIPSKDFRDSNGNCLVQVLSVGRQTVIPPSVHPDTGVPYVWSGERTLLDTNVESLPELPHDYLDRIKAIIGSGGKVLEEEQEKAPPPPDGYDDDGPYAELKNLALYNLEKWVPDLGLYNCQRGMGRYATYKAVATWRPSTTGRRKEDRAQNLSIARKGIKDFGTGKGYSAIDLVMAARGCDLSAAFDWLAERVMPKDEIEIDVEKLKSANGADKAERGDDGGDDDARVGAEDDDALAALLGHTGITGTPCPNKSPCLFRTSFRWLASAISAASGERSKPLS